MCRQVYFFIGSYAKVGKGTIIQRIESLMDAKDTMVGRMDLFEEGGNEHQQKLETVFYKQRCLLNVIVRLLEKSPNADVRRSCRSSGQSPSLRTEFDKKPGARDVVDAAGDPKDCMRPMERRAESVPYGLSPRDPGVLPFIPDFFANVMLAEKTPENGSGIGTLKRSAQEDMVDIGESAAETLCGRPPHP